MNTAKSLHTNAAKIPATRIPTRSTNEEQRAIGRLLSSIPEAATTIRGSKRTRHDLEDNDAPSSLRSRCNQGARRKRSGNDDIQDEQPPGDTHRRKFHGPSPHQHEVQADLSHRRKSLNPNRHPEELSQKVSHEAAAEHTCTAMRSDSGPSNRDGPYAPLSAPIRAAPKPYATSNTDDSIARLLRKQ